jgi:hypothetical protein
MGNRAALLAVIMLGACGGGGAKKTTTKPTGPTPGSGSAAVKPVEPPKPKPEPVDVATLEVWAGNVDGGAVTVAAADVDGEVLRRALVPAAIEIITVRNEVLVTGKVAGSRVGVLAALTAKEPALKLGPRVKLAGKPQVSFDFVGAESRDLFRILGDVMATNVVAVAPSTKITVSAKDAGAAKLLDAIVKVADLVTEKAAPNITIVRAKSQPKVGKLAGKGAKIDLKVTGARAGDVLALIGAVTGAKAPSGECTAGDAIDLRLRAVPSGVASKLVEKLSGAKATACALPSVPDSIPKEQRLVATATSGTKKFGIVMDGDRAFLFEITKDPVGGMEESRPAERMAPPSDPFEGARLAATIAGLDIAIVEGGGQFRTVTRAAGGPSGAGLVSVGVGEITVQDAAGATRVMKLEKRPQ